MTGERLARIGAVATAVLAAFGALISEGDVEVTLLMVAAVIAGLVCFDVSMGRGLRDFGPWALLSLAPVLKTAPDVWFQLRASNGILQARYDHAGSLLFGVCVFAATAMIARPAPSLGRSVAGFDAAVLFGSATTGALAGASVAFLPDSSFGSVTAGRLLETPTWFVLAGTLAAVVVATSHARHMGFALSGVLIAATATTALLALSVAGRELDRGWWALLFAVLGASAVGEGGDLGSRTGRNRRSNAWVVIALVVGLIAAASAIAARSDRAAWSPGWALLGLIALAMFGLALASKPLEGQYQYQGEGQGQDQGQGQVVSDPSDSDLDDDRRARRARARALNDLDLGFDDDAIGEMAENNTSDEAPLRLSLTNDAAQTAPGLTSALEPSALETSAPQPERVAAKAPADGGPDQVASAPIRVARVQQPLPEPAAAGLTAQVVAGAQLPVAAEPGVANSPKSVTHAPQEYPQADIATPATPPTPNRAPVAAEPTPTPPTLSDASLVATAQAAAAVRTAPPVQRHSLAPLAQAHHFDPSTGLLSAAGLQHAIARAFDVPRRAGHVTMLMFMIRDLDRIESEHGRLASAAVTREVADRVNTLLPNGSGARFARAAYAVIFVGDRSNAHETTQWLARVLLQLRAPVEGGSLGDKIDVVAGMAQCYESEDAANFVKRANSGLARAVQLSEPTLVAMP